ncbi:MAG: hypothetical protein IPI38_17120 [Gemmatimonadetes bacterium]|nr:hypothetical protein [Gemmatimonadota bacterium]MBK7717110.1 hypothetical protein [Gemmatimonadota bacterium]
MRHKLRIKLDAAARVIDFYRRHPDDAAAVQAARERLQVLLARVSAMILSQQASQDEMRVAMAEREAAGEEMAGHITHLARLTAAIATAVERPELRLSPRPAHERKGTVLARAREALMRGEDHRELLVEYGMPPALLAQLADAIARYQAAEERRARCSDLSLRATATFVAAAQEAHGTILHLDALNRMQFADDLERLMAWHQAATLRWNEREAVGR